MTRDVSESSAEGVDMLGNWVCYNEDFSRRLEQHEFPIAVLLDTQTPFSGMRVGMYQPDGTRVVFDILGEVIRDEETREFLAGVVTCRDVTSMAKEIDQMKVRDLERFKMICDIVGTLASIFWDIKLTVRNRSLSWCGAQTRMVRWISSTAGGPSSRA